MAIGTNHYKLGLFVIVGLAMALTFVITLGARNWNAESVKYTSYFDESVQGLDVGSPVKFRGVTVGRVSAIGVAPDQRHVQVVSELTVPELRRLNLGGGGESPLDVHPDLRAQLAQAGLTGVKFILLDYFEGADYPDEVLPFAVPANLIPSAPSTLKGIESSMVKTADNVPQIAEDLRATMTRVNALMEEVERARIPQQAGQALGQTVAAMTRINEQLATTDVPALSGAVRHSLAAFDGNMVRMGKLMDRLEREDGVLANAERTLAMVGEMARGGNSIGPELELTLREIRGSARSLRRFSEALERDPDMLLKGRAGK
jgi:phospholipid/cholesterol/gamma-HCH transport system substrate-binding protein